MHKCNKKKKKAITHCYTLDVALRVVDVCGLKQQLVSVEMFGIPDQDESETSDVKEK